MAVVDAVRDMAGRVAALEVAALAVRRHRTAERPELER